MNRDELPAGREPEEDFANRIAAPLRAPERPGPGFEARVMELILAESRKYPAARRPWWRRSLVVRMSPLGGLAMAAGFAGLVILGTLVATGRFDREREALAAAPSRSEQLVRFAVRAPGANQVSLVGTFNRWEKDATLLSAMTADGVWTISLRLPPGRHEYAFIVDGKRWVIDPLAATITDDFGTETSVIRVRGSSES